MPYLTMKEKSQLQLGPGLVASYDIQPGNGVALFWDTKHTHIFTYLLTFPGPTRGGSVTTSTAADDVELPLSLTLSLSSCQCHHCMLSQHAVVFSISYLHKLCKNK